MNRSKVAILGASGMLGSMVLDCLARDKELSLIATVRGARFIQQGRRLFPNVEWRVFDAEQSTELDSASVLAEAVDGADWVVNAIGKTKPYAHDDNPAEVEGAIRVNAELPYLLGRTAQAKGARIVQIATDCVYSGREGGYVESAPHDALDVYGKSKSLGECLLPNVMNLRCSIIGPEPRLHMFLLEWFRQQPANAQLKGFTNHEWNGVTTLQFARICRGIIRENLPLPHLLHVVPTDTISKAELLECMKREFRRPDIRIEHVSVPSHVDRTLKTEQAPLNEQVWRAAGYANIPTVPEMMREVAAYEYRLGGAFS